tara:strand:- start:4394 stop:4612 length:219 start_codon:yes stop_codon:yes gene_type:complete
MLDRLLGVDEQSLAYDLSRAHSADVFFIKIRALLWGAIVSVVCFFLGNILGANGINFLGMFASKIKHLFGLG